MIRKIIIIVLVTLGIFVYADSVDDAIREASITKNFVIVKSTSDYNEAKNYAKKVAKHTDIKLNLRGLTFHKKNHLTHDKETCKDYGTPCYFARGRYDDGEYISIEYSGSYKNFKNGYYIVIVASGNDVNQTLRKVRKVVPDVYIKLDVIYMGCMH